MGNITTTNDSNDTNNHTDYYLKQSDETTYIQLSNKSNLGAVRALSNLGAVRAQKFPAKGHFEFPPQISV
jgi:hypothetical protein